MLTALVRPTENAIANGDTRSLTMQHMHTGETIQITYKQNGQYVPDALQKLNWFLRDWRREEPTRMDPRLFDTIWLAYRDTGASAPVHVLCGYRAPETNAMLRRRSRGVAKFSQHTLGKAMDFYIPGVSLVSLRYAGLRLQRGGVGFYPQSNFVHLDAGSVRMWPRMSRQELASVFPDGKTVQIPADGKPMPGYQEAFNAILRNGGSVGGVGGSEDDSGSGVGDTEVASASGGSFFSAFTGGGAASRNDDDTSAQSFLMADAARRNGTDQPVARQPAAAVASRVPVKPVAPVPAAPIPAAAPTVVAMADIPLPTPKPAELEAPAMAWQTGPQGIALNVPLPPERPDDANTAPAAAAVPMQVAALVPPPEPPTPPSKPQLLEPGAPVMSDVSDGIGDLLKRNLPRGLVPTSEPAAALGFASPDEPVLMPRHQPLPPLISTRLEGLNFASVSAPVPAAQDMAQAGLVMPDLNSTASLIPAPIKIVVMHFGLTAYQDLRSGQFSGAAVKPLRTASFALAPDLIITGSIARTSQTIEN